MKKAFFCAVIFFITSIAILGQQTPVKQEMPIGKETKSLYTVYNYEEYDINGNLIYRENPYDFQEWFEYDENNLLIHTKDSNFIEWNYFYDKKGHLEQKVSNQGEVYKRRIIYAVAGFYQGYTSTTGEKIIYDNKGRLLYSKAGFGETEYTYTYNDKGLLVKTEIIGGATTTFQYDSNGNIVDEKSENYTMHYINEYDRQGRLIRVLTADTFEVINLYDENGNLIYCKNPSSYHQEEWYSYTFYEDGKTIKTRTTYFRY